MKRTTCSFDLVTRERIERYAGPGERTAFLARLVEEFDAREQAKVPRKVHELKCWPPFFDAIVSGAKTHEIRKDDRGYVVGDLLRLFEWSPPEKGERKGTYTGRACDVLVTHITRDVFGLPSGVVVMSVKLENGR
jgi:hypothetical protein